MTIHEHRIVVRRTARYVTLGDRDGADEIWFVLHGYSQLARHFVRWFEPAVRPGRLIVAPEALSRAYFDEAKGLRRVGASWMTKEDREAEIGDYVEYLDQLADAVIPAAAADLRVEVHGFSQGGAAAARWATFGRCKIDRLVLWGSTLPPDLDVERLRTRLRGVPLEIVIGDRDRYVAPELGQADAARLLATGVSARFTSFSGTHRVDRDALSRLADRLPTGGL